MSTDKNDRWGRCYADREMDAWCAVRIEGKSVIFVESVVSGIVF